MKTMPIHRWKTRALSCRGWSLIELVGAMAILALMMGLLSPALQSRIESEARAREQQALSELARASREHLRRTGTFPADGDLPPWLALAAGWRHADVATNSRSLRRALLIDPGWIAGPPPSGGVPFAQGPSGSGDPVRVRWLLLSSLGEPLPDRVLAGEGIDAPAFDALWNTPPGSVPAGWTWSGLASDLLVERIDFREEFVPVTVEVRGAGRARIAQSNQVWTPDLGRQERWFLRDTLLRFEDESGLQQALEVVTSPTGWAYYGGKWHSLGAGNLPETIPTGRDFSELAEALVRLPTRPGLTTNSAARLVSALHSYHTAYIGWAESGLAGPLQDASGPVVAWRELREAVTAMVQTGSEGSP